MSEQHLVGARITESLRLANDATTASLGNMETAALQLGWHFSNDRVMVRKVTVGPLKNNVYVVACAATNQSIVIDAAAEPDAIIAHTAGTVPTSIVTTHGHWDHVGAAKEVSRRMDVPVLIGEADTPMSGLKDTEPLESGTLQVGDLAIVVVATPGHTPGSHCLVVDGLLFSGDTLFPGGPGATGSPADFAQIMRSLETKIFVLDDSTTVLPGHGPDTTLGAERATIPEWHARGW